MRVRPGGSWLLRRSMRGRPRLTLAADVDVYFCDPHAPWQRGSNENTNRLLRQYEPPRVCRRLQLLGDWSYDKADLSEIFTGSARACRADGA